MYIYNVTINIDDSIHEPWLKWVDNHIKDVLATKRFISARLTRVLIEEEMGGTTYSVQYTAKTRQDLDNYYKYDAEVLRNNSAIFVAFRTELEVIKEY